MDIQLVDTHCHIQSVDAASGERHTRELWAKAGDLNADTVIANAMEAGVKQMICIGCDLEDSKLAVAFVKNRENCWASIGIHPHEAQHYAGQEAKLAQFEALAAAGKVVAIGECGFDFYYNHSPVAAQKAVLEFQLEVAKKHGLPVVFHVRQAFEDFWPVYDRYNVPGVLHSFTDTLENLQLAIKRQLYIGVNGIATFSKDPAQLDVYRLIPLERLLLETDAPFLTPTPYRGSINQPKQTRVVAEFIANLRGISLEQLAAATTQNAHNLFGIQG